MPFSRSKQQGAEAARSKQAEVPSGGSDLLIRFFESDWFDAFIALT